MLNISSNVIGQLTCEFENITYEFCGLSPFCGNSIGEHCEDKTWIECNCKKGDLYFVLDCSRRIIVENDLNGTL
jgi:hypothetical protein